MNEVMEEAGFFNLLVAVSARIIGLFLNLNLFIINVIMGKVRD